MVWHAQQHHRCAITLLGQLDCQECQLHLRGGGGGDPPEEPWKGILAELIYMCSGAVLLGVYIYTHLHLYK